MEQKRVMKAALGVSLAVVIIAAGVFGVVAGISRNVAKIANVAKTRAIGTDDGFIISSTNGSKLMSLTTAEESGTKSYTITATVKDSSGAAYTSYQDVTYSMAWASTKGDNVTDYVTMTTRGASATFTCLQPFDTQIVVTCTSNVKTNISATATLDYYQRMETLSDSSDTWEHYGTSGDPLDDTEAYGNNYFIYYTAPSFGVGTIVNSVEKYEAKFTVSDKFYSDLLDYSKEAKELTGTQQQTFTVSSDDDSMHGKISQEDFAIDILSPEYWVSVMDLENGGPQESESAVMWFQSYEYSVKNTSNQLTIEVTVTPKYGEAQTYKKSVNLVLATSGISTLSLDTTNYIF